MKVIKKLFSLFLVSLLIVCVIPLAVGVNIVDNGICGTNLTWTLDSQGTLTISGTGEMLNHPWDDLRSNINKVVIQNGVTSICSEAFYDCRNLKAVIIPQSVTSIDDKAFSFTG